mmetsp:Transcript_3006/g.6259  ORF Transcript_3006/g.6259 Transcript_3006/m.6259 type:complete len:216 (-) Transcript_3006:667-1314(-)
MHPQSKRVQTRFERISIVCSSANELWLSSTSSLYMTFQHAHFPGRCHFVCCHRHASLFHAFGNGIHRTRIGLNQVEDVQGRTELSFYWFVIDNEFPPYKNLSLSTHKLIGLLTASPVFRARLKSESPVYRFAYPRSSTRVLRPFWWPSSVPFLPLSAPFISLLFGTSSVNRFCCEPPWYRTRFARLSLSSRLRLLFTDESSMPSKSVEFSTSGPL